jgi:hypothetical protein
MVLSDETDMKLVNSNLLESGNYKLYDHCKCILTLRNAKSIH